MTYFNDSDDGSSETETAETDTEPESENDIDEYRYFTADPDTEAPDFYTLLQIARDDGLVGEEENILTVALGMLRGRLIIIYGVSRSGKDEIVEAAISLYKSDYVYEWPTDESPTAPYYNADEINEYPAQYFGDIARIQEHQEKVLKDFGEGNDSERDVTDISAPDGEETKLQKLEYPRVTLATIALDNQNVDLNDFPELLKRALLLSADASKEQTDRVVLRKAREHDDKVDKNVDPVEVAKIRQYLNNIPVELFEENPNNKIVKMTAVEIARQGLMPTEFPEARFDVDRFFEFIGTVSLFNHADRITVDTGRGLKMLTAPVDVWYAMKILGERMIMSSLNLTDEDQAVLRYMRESKSSVNKTDIQTGLRDAGYHINDRDIKRSLDSMREKGYVQVDKNTSPYTYSLSPFASITDFDVGLDYESIVEVMKEEVYNVSGIPEEVADEYVERYCEGTGTFAVNPFTGEEIDIMEDASLQETVDESTDAVADVFDEPFANGDDENGESDESEDTEDLTGGTLS